MLAYATTELKSPVACPELPYLSRIPFLAPLAFAKSIAEVTAP